MKKISTPFFLLSTLTLVICTYILIVDKHGWGYLLSFYLIPLAFIVLLADLLMKKLIKSFSKILVIELVVIGIVTLAYYYGERTKTLVIDNNFKKEYISIVYGVENEEKLGISTITWKKTIHIPKNGILLTSTDFNIDLPRTEMRYESGDNFGETEEGKHFVFIGDYQLKFDGQTYKYRSWKIQEGFCCAYSSSEVKEQAEKILVELNKNLSTKNISDQLLGP